MCGWWVVGQARVYYATYSQPSSQISLKIIYHNNYINNNNLTNINYEVVLYEMINTRGVYPRLSPC